MNNVSAAVGDPFTRQSELTYSGIDQNNLGPYGLVTVTLDGWNAGLNGGSYTFMDVAVGLYGGRNFTNNGTSFPRNNAFDFNLTPLNSPFNSGPATTISGYFSNVTQGYRAETALPVHETPYSPNGPYFTNAIVWDKPIYEGNGNNQVLINPGSTCVGPCNSLVFRFTDIVNGVAIQAPGAPGTTQSLLGSGGGNTLLSSTYDSNPNQSGWWFAANIDQFGNSPSSTVAARDFIGVTSIPEPETYAMMLAGLGLMGFVAARRRKPPSAT